MKGKDIFKAMAEAAKRKDWDKIRELREQIAKNMDERGCFYDDEFGWVYHSRVQDAITRGWITFDEHTDSYRVAGTTVVSEQYNKTQRRRNIVPLTVAKMTADGFDIDSLVPYLQGGVLKKL